MTIKEHAGQLVLARCWCGIQHAIPESLQREQMSAKERGSERTVYCPLGHAYVVGTGKTPAEERADALERQLARERAAHDQTRADRFALKNHLNAEKSAKSRLKNRVGAGVCPCCNRTFSALARHMANQHPDFRKE